MTEGSKPRFDRRYDEQFPCGFTDGHGQDLLTLRWKPLWSMTAQEVIGALKICEIAADEANANAVGERDAWPVEERFWRLKCLVHYMVADQWAEHVRMGDKPKMSHEGAIVTFWPGG